MKFKILPAAVKKETLDRLVTISPFGIARLRFYYSVMFQFDLLRSNKAGFPVFEIALYRSNIFGFNRKVQAITHAIPNETVELNVTAKLDRITASYKKQGDGANIPTDVIAFTVENVDGWTVIEKQKSSGAVAIG